MSRIYKKTSNARSSLLSGIAFGGGGGGGGGGGYSPAALSSSEEKTNSSNSPSRGGFYSAPTRVSEGAHVSRGNYIADRTGNSTGTRVANIASSKALSEKEKSDNLNTVMNVVGTAALYGAGGAAAVFATGAARTIATISLAGNALKDVSK